MVATTNFRWDPARLNAALDAGLRSSVTDASKVAQALNPAKGHIRIYAKGFPNSSGGPDGVIAGKGALAHLFEEGTEPHLIAPGGLKIERTARSSGKTSVRAKRGGKKALAGGLAHPISVPIQHPGMREKPFIKPAAQAWPSIYKRDASSALARSGFGRR